MNPTAEGTVQSITLKTKGTCIIFCEVAVLNHTAKGEA